MEQLKKNGVNEWKAYSRKFDIEEQLFSTKEQCKDYLMNIVLEQMLIK